MRTQTLDIWPFRPASDAELELVLRLLADDFASFRNFELTRSRVADRELRAELELDLAALARISEPPVERLYRVAEVLRQYPEVRLELRPSSFELQSSGYKSADERVVAARTWFGSYGVGNQVEVIPVPTAPILGIDVSLVAPEAESSVELAYEGVEELLREARDLAELARREYNGDPKVLQATVRSVLKGAPWGFGILSDQPGELRTEWLRMPGPVRGIPPFRKQWQRTVMFTVAIKPVELEAYQLDVRADVQISRLETGPWQKDDLFSHQKELVRLLRLVDVSLKKES